MGPSTKGYVFDALDSECRGEPVLRWAPILFGTCIFALAAVASMVIGHRRDEFSSMYVTMLTIVRCVTEGCRALDGTPSQQPLLEMYGPIFAFVCYVFYLAVTIGLFNLIMSIFIRPVMEAGITRLQ